LKKFRPLKSFEIKRYYQLPLILFSIFLVIGLYPGVGGEGAQREVPRFLDKHDFSGFVTPLVYGFWPDSWISWLYSLSIFQIVIYSTGMKLFFDKLSNNTLRNMFIFVYIVGVFFVFQVVRDATAFSLFVFGFGIITKSNKSKHYFYVIGVGAIILGCLFKPILAPIIAITYLFFSSKQHLTFKSRLIRVVIAIFIAFAPFFMDRGITSELELDKRYPEQQLFIYDVTKMYCWGHKSSSIELAKNSISPFLQMGSDHESLCASLEPMGADDLRRKLIEVKDSPAIKLYEGGNSNIVRKLFSDWLKLIKESPFEWSQIKTIDASQVLFMANAIYINPVIEDNADNSLLEIGDKILKAAYIPINIMDRLRIYSLSFSLLIGLLLIYVNGRFTAFDKKVDQIVYKYIVINLSIWFMFTLLFISNPGRYTLPYLLLSYIYLITSLDERYKKMFRDI
jgi:hypothetical protein